MSWEKRNTKHYYYRKHRQGQHVVSEYIGAGELAQASAGLDALERQLRQAKRQQRQAIRAADAQIIEVCNLIRRLTYGLLLATGHHTHKGQWRKTRNDH